MTKNAKTLLLAYELGYRCDANGIVRSSQNRILKLYPNKMGYLHFSIKLNLDLHHKKISRAIPVHRLQAYQKFGNEIFDSDKQVRHLNSKCSDNSWDNIGIGSRSENMMDKPVDLRLSIAIQASSKKRRFTDLEMEEIKMFYNENRSYKLTMEKYNISSKGTLYNMLNVKYQTNK